MDPTVLVAEWLLSGGVSCVADESFHIDGGVKDYPLKRGGDPRRGSPPRVSFDAVGRRRGR